MHLACALMFDRSIDMAAANVNARARACGNVRQQLHSAVC